MEWQFDSLLDFLASDQGIDDPLERLLALAHVVNELPFHLTVVLGDEGVESFNAAANSDHYGLELVFKGNLARSNQVALLPDMHHWDGNLKPFYHLLDLIFKFVALAWFELYWSVSENFITVLLYALTSCIWLHNCVLHVGIVWLDLRWLLKNKNILETSLR